MKPESIFVEVDQRICRNAVPFTFADDGGSEMFEDSMSSMSSTLLQAAARHLVCCFGSELHIGDVCYGPVSAYLKRNNLQSDKER
jgi:hypothetical protein